MCILWNKSKTSQVVEDTYMQTPQSSPTLSTSPVYRVRHSTNDFSSVNVSVNGDGDGDGDERISDISTRSYYSFETDKIETYIVEPR